MLLDCANPISGSMLVMSKRKLSWFDGQ
uniref:Uncharacterized protein n=1 Tax=Heterorhabditis bacteriophora TaxID=37862 RepID=A0A1I7WA11_HETBA